MRINVEYKDHNIDYDEDNNKWLLNRFSPSKESYDSLKAAKSAIDRKLKKKYVEQSVWVLGGVDPWNNDGFKSIKQIKATRPHKGNEFWLTDGKNRKARSGSDIYLDTENNRKLFMQIAEQEKIASAASSQAYDLKQQLETLQEMKPVD